MGEDVKLGISDYLPLREVVFNTLRDAILNGDLKPGEHLMEIQLAQRLGVSRTPVREAIRKLELEGFAVMVPRKGAEVANITEKNLKDVLEVRKALEDLAVRLTCKRMCPDDLVKLIKQNDRFKEVLKNASLTEWVQEDIKFHDIIYAAADNERLNHILNNLRQQMYRYRREYLKNRENHEEVVREHNEIIQALRVKNSDQAAKVIKKHIDNQETGVIVQMKENKQE